MSPAARGCGLEWLNANGGLCPEADVLTCRPAYSKRTRGPYRSIRGCELNEHRLSVRLPRQTVPSPCDCSCDRPPCPALSNLGSVVAAEAETCIRPARAALTEPPAEGAIRPGQQARGADALLAEQAPGLTIASLMVRTTTSDLIAVIRVLLEPDDPEVCGPAPEQRYRLHHKRATMSMPWLRLSATAVGQPGSRAHDAPG